MILVDTSVLSLAFRRRRSASIGEHPAARQLRALVEEDEDVRLPGVVFQEILSGLRSERDFEVLRAAVAGFPLVLADGADHEAAGRLANQCRRAGVAATTVDCLIASQAIRRGARLFTTDADFSAMKKVSDLTLHPVDD